MMTMALQKIMNKRLQIMYISSCKYRERSQNRNSGQWWFLPCGAAQDALRSHMALPWNIDALHDVFQFIIPCHSLTLPCVLYLWASVIAVPPPWNPFLSISTWKTLIHPCEGLDVTSSRDTFYEPPRGFPFLCSAGTHFIWPPGEHAFYTSI